MTLASWLSQDDTERWRPIVGYEDFYSVSDFGRVRSLDRQKFNGVRVFMQKGKIMIPQRSQNGHLYVTLHKHKKKKIHHVHLLVLEAFVEKIEDKTLGEHIDGDRTNNNFSNLYWR